MNVSGSASSRRRDWTREGAEESLADVWQISRTARYPSRFSSSPSTIPNVVFVAGSRSTRVPYARGSRRAGTSPSFPRSALKCMAHPSMTHELIANILGGR